MIPFLNGAPPAAGFDMEKWGVFENYFKAGNYLQAREPDAYARVKFYELTATH